MATRQKRPEPIAELETNDPWRQVSEPLEMQNGVMAIHWRNMETGQTRIVPAGVHPDDQALESYALQAPEAPQEEETATDRVAALLQVAGGADRADVRRRRGGYHRCLCRTDQHRCATRLWPHVPDPVFRPHPQRGGAGNHGSGQYHRA